MNYYFSFRLCADVLLEVLRRGNRLQVAKLEAIGCRFHYLINRYMDQSPYHLINLDISIRQ